MMRRLALVTLLALSTPACDRLPGLGKDSSEARSMPDFGGVEVVEVTAEGVGPTRNAALLDALNLAVRKTNGTPIEGVTENLNGSLALLGTSGDFGITLDNVTAVTRGAVKSFEIVREREGAGAWKVKVKAKVAKYKDPAASGLPKVVIALPRTHASTFVVGDETLSSEAAASSVRSAVAAAVSRSNRFFVINRDYDSALDAEAATITSENANPAELAKLGQRFSADILILPEIRRLEYRKSSRTLRYSGRELRSYAGGAEIAFNVLNVATGQLILSEQYSVEFPVTPPTVTGAQAVDGRAVEALLGDLAEQFTRTFIQKNFPVSIVKMEGTSVTLSQGAALLKPGETYEVVMLGEEIRDPQTGQSLGRDETGIGQVTVTRTLDKVSLGTYRGAFDTRRFKPGMLELRPSLAAERAASPPKAPPTSAQDQAVQAPATATKAASVAAPQRRAKAADDFDKDFEF